MTDIEYLKKYYQGDLTKALEQLKQNIPVQYIVGNVDFLNTNILVNSDVLIPRFETELLVEKTIHYLENRSNDKISILDIGTGSGCIAISLKKFFLLANVTACDISEKALAIAKKNSLRNDCPINFVKSDLLQNVKGKFDLVIANPPYIAYDEKIDDLVKNNEPSLALYADNNGLYFYEKILKNISLYLNEKSLIAFEIGMTQGEEIKKMASFIFPKAKITIEQDYSGKNRFIFISKEN